VPAIAEARIVGRFWQDEGGTFHFSFEAYARIAPGGYELAEAHIFLSDQRGLFAVIDVDLGPLQVQGELNVFTKGTVYLDARASLIVDIPSIGSLNLGGAYVFFTNCKSSPAAVPTGEFASVTKPGFDCGEFGSYQFKFHVDQSAFLGFFTVRIGGGLDPDGSTNAYIRSPAAERVGPGAATTSWSTGSIDVGFMRFGGTFEFWFELALRSAGGTKSIPIFPSQLQTGARISAWAEFGYPCWDGGPSWCWGSRQTASLGATFRASPFEICAEVFGERLCIP
jgi:hypothetical protein